MADDGVPRGPLTPAAFALLGAGRENGEVVAHLRDAGPHVRGCGVIDVPTGRS